MPPPPRPTACCSNACGRAAGASPRSCASARATSTRARAPLVLENRKQKRGSRKKRVYVSTDLVAQLQVLARDARIGYRSCFFRSAKSGEEPMSTVHAWRIVTACSQRAGVQVQDADGVLRPANARDFRHGAAVNQVQQGIPLREVQQQLGHARIDSTTIYTRLAIRSAAW